ncbi:hypothetical protein FHS16_000985 [Paenibacillus endophyticus]|uniref:PKD domain-containing protein n=1 Tax=Paenibacillus endophyticus TaxID=1294268 RepID=A0A7W5C4G4_9BACL|nr:CARDB domain-containing protein [Paenibacillus endophyticus]MBB3150951.1 hypothetical protein [Paenibacillus endophyticus]
MKQKKIKIGSLVILILSLFLTSTSYSFKVGATEATDCLSYSYKDDAEKIRAQNYLKQLGISETSNGKSLNIGFLLNKCGVGEAVIVYGNPTHSALINSNTYDQGQWRYLGWDREGNLYRNWKFRSDSRATLHVAKNWVKNPWDTSTGKKKGVLNTSYSDNEALAASWLQDMTDPYGESKTFLQSYNKRRGTNWTGDTILDYAIIQQPRTQFSPGVVQMWNIWEPDGSWWYEMFTIPPPELPKYQEFPDLVITEIKADPLIASSSWVGDSVTVNITTKNEGQTNTGAFTVGVDGTSIKSEIIPNVPPGQIKTVAIKVSSSTAGIIKYTAKTDFGLAITESNENNNTMPFQIVYSKKNEPTIPIAIISHLEGDHRTTPELTFKPAGDPQLDDKLSYSPGKEAITIREWKYKTPSGTTLQKKPTAKDFSQEGKYLVELRVTNSAKKVSEWAQLTINVGEFATPAPSAEPTPTPRPELKAAIRFVPDKILAGETSSLLNSSDGFDSFTWNFTSNLDPIFTDKSKYEYYDQTFTQPGTYRATIRVSDSSGAATADATLTVIDPKPVAVVSGASKVIEGRSFPFPYHLNHSYTPLADRGVTIDYSKSEKRFKKVDGSGYTLDFPITNNLALGEYLFEGKVYDTTGRVSDWADLLVEVVPDLPPTIEIVAPEEAYRSNGFMLYMEAESPDYDKLEHLMLEERYDANGNGNFDEEAWKVIYDGAYKTTHSLKYAAVGKRQYRATVTEDYGKSSNSGIAATDILNYAPSVNFNAFGVTQQPGQDEDSGPPVTNYTAQSILRSWVAKRPYLGGNADKVAWKADSSIISTKVGQPVNFNLRYPEAGMGLNNRNKYTLPSDLVVKPKWEIQPYINGSYDLDTRLASTHIFNNNRIYTYYRGLTNSNYQYTIRDAVTGAQLDPSFTLDGGTWDTELQEDEKFYRRELIDQSYVKITSYADRGQTKEVHTFNLTGVDSRRISLTSFKLTPDFKSAIIAVVHNDRNYGKVQTNYYKYSFENRAVVWVAMGAEYSKDAGGSYSFTPEITFAPDGTIYIAGTVITKISPNGVRIDSPIVDGHSAGSPVTLSDDGQYVYRVNVSSISGDEMRYTLTTYKASDLSVVNKYANSDYYDRYDESQYGNFSPVVRTDGNLLLTNRSAQYLFTKTGTLLLKSNLFREYDYNSYLNITYQPGVLPNGDVFSLERNRMMFYGYGIYNITQQTNIVMVNTAIGPDWAAGGGSVYTTPILPNGSVFFIDTHHWPHTVVPMVSQSGNTNLQDIDANTVGVFDDHWGGLLYDAGSVMKNYAFEFNVSVNDIKNDKLIGAGFHIQNEKNMYSVEWSKTHLILYKAVNGVKTALQSLPLTLSPFTTYLFKIEAANGKLSVFLNNNKRIEVTDTTYTKGAVGIMSLGQSSVSFSNVKKTNYGDTYTQETYDSVLVNDSISYERLFIDIENDPMATEEWSYSHNPNFFENPEGMSVHHAKTYGTTINALEKAGVYEIKFRAQDNPGLTNYRKWSESVKKLLYVHRRPVAQPDVRFTGKVFAEGEALDYEAFDSSYDPDIAHILADKVFRTRWADQDTWTAGKREYYNRPGVELIVQEQVRDIHGAWSYWGQSIVYKAAIVPVNQTKPVMTITSPAGLTASSPTVLTKEPVIHWTYYDAQNDPQQSYRLVLAYADNNETALYLEHEGNARSYSIVEDIIDPGRVVKVYGQVSSSGVWSNISNSRYFVLDLPPKTYLLSFNGEDANQPIYTKSSRPLLRVFTVDPENHPIKAIDYEVFHAGTGAKVADSELATAAASYSPAALAEGLHYWRARANDSYLWGPYSSNGFFFVDTVKPADVNEQLAIEPTAVSVSFETFKDASPSSGHASRMFYLQKVNANGSVTNIDLNRDGQAEYSVPLALESTEYRVAGLEAGQEYRLTVIDHDIAGNEGKFAYIYFVTNRPPTADFDWTPKPIYEGDLTSFMSIASDPDGDALSIFYELTNPDGKKSSYSYVTASPGFKGAGPALKLDISGMWRMTLSVNDGVAAPVQVTKTVQVLPLQLTGLVKHTEQWKQRRKAFNFKSSGNENKPRGQSVFWAGEKFMLEATTTLTGTATKAEKVVVKVDGYEAVLTPVDAVSRDMWKGELWNEEFSKLPNGDLRFEYIVYYNNGTMKTDWVPITIEGQSLQLVGVHRVQ